MGGLSVVEMRRGLGERARKLHKTDVGTVEVLAPAVIGSLCKLLAAQYGPANVVLGVTAPGVVAIGVVQ